MTEEEFKRVRRHRIETALLRTQLQQILKARAQLRTLHTKVKVLVKGDDVVISSELPPKALELDNELKEVEDHLIKLIKEHYAKTITQVPPHESAETHPIH